MLRCWNGYRFPFMGLNCGFKTPKWKKPKGYKTNITIMNPITKSKVPLITQSNKYLTWYICGPTVYDSSHIGHACTYMRFDIIRRIIEKYTNLIVLQAMCITDIDDKIIQRSNELNINYQELTNRYTREFFDDLDLLDIKRPSLVGRVTDFIPQIIQFIETLIHKDMAYVTSEGSVYFNINKYQKHGKLIQIHKSENSNTIDDTTDKLELSDFALWKHKTDKPYWESPWGIGRPGWHIECSTIASNYFGNTIDLHTGGIDLRFPHHENEESQSCAYHDVNQWVNYWLHTGHVQYKNEKMSKSLQNTIKVKEFLENNSVNYLRMLCLYSNTYRTLINLDSDEITHSIEMCTNIFQFFDNCRTYIQGNCISGNVDSNMLLKKLEETRQNVDSYLIDDFNTKSCIFTLLELVSYTNGMIYAPLGNRCPTSVGLVYSYIESMLQFLGLEFTSKSLLNDKEEYSASNTNIIDNAVKFRSNVRNTALMMEGEHTKELKSRLLTYCDDFRAHLKEDSISLKDFKNDFSSWSYVTSTSVKRNFVKHTLEKKRKQSNSNA